MKRQHLQRKLSKGVEKSICIINHTNYVSEVLNLLSTLLGPLIAVLGYEVFIFTIVARV